MATGFRYEQVSIGAVLTNLEIAFAFIVDTVFLHESVTILSVVGATAVFLGGAIVTLGSRSSSSGEG